MQLASYDRRPVGKINWEVELNKLVNKKLPHNELQKLFLLPEFLFLHKTRPDHAYCSCQISLISYPAEPQLFEDKIPKIYYCREFWTTFAMFSQCL